MESKKKKKRVKNKQIINKMYTKQEFEKAVNYYKEVIKNEQARENKENKN